ncbi:DUF6053 domain-containing protein [Lysobacter enzymogenes]|uniref:DUF6053 domain-containing protein n=1 Tax=Lysobacter enzymogenes TaxID=69 RepID=UPI00374953CC
MAGASAPMRFDPLAAPRFEPKSVGPEGPPTIPRPDIPGGGLQLRRLSIRSLRHDLSRQHRA